SPIRWAPARWRRGPASSVRWRLEVDDDGHVIGGAFPFAFLPVDPHPADPLGSGGRGEREIDPHPVVAGERQPLVIPVRVLARREPAAHLLVTGGFDLRERRPLRGGHVRGTGEDLDIP